MKIAKLVIISSLSLVIGSFLGGNETEMYTEAVNASWKDSDQPPIHLRIVASGWKTRWSQSSIDLNELMHGGPKRDGIPPIDLPKFTTVESAASWLAGSEPVMAVEIDGEAKAYPLQILMWHEIVNDTIGNTPVTVTFCPLCNSAMTFDRRVEGKLLSFGTSGLLRNSDLVMWDRQTESLWQQITGEAIVGALNGARLTYLPSSLISFSDFRTIYPDGLILSRKTGVRRPYGKNPYKGYDSLEQPRLYSGEFDHRFPAMERVVTFSIGDKYYALSQAILAEKGVINMTVSDVDMAVFYTSGTNSALDSAVVAEGRDTGSTGVFRAQLEGEKLTFKMNNNDIVDEQTGSTWNILGKAVAGKLKGKSLEPIAHGNHFWFAWVVFRPETTVI